MPTEPGVQYAAGPLVACVCGTPHRVAARVATLAARHGYTPRCPRCTAEIESGGKRKVLPTGKVVPADAVLVAAVEAGMEYRQIVAKFGQGLTRADVHAALRRSGKIKPAKGDAVTGPRLLVLLEGLTEPTCARERGRLRASGRVPGPLDPYWEVFHRCLTETPEAAFPARMGSWAWLERRGLPQGGGAARYRSEFEALLNGGYRVDAEVGGPGEPDAGAEAEAEGRPDEGEGPEAAGGLPGGVGE